MINIFKKCKEIYAPVEGSSIKIENVKDEIFAKKMLGDGIAIIPQNDTVLAPIDGEIVMIANTKHAFGIKGKHGLEILVHVGLDSVKLKGKGFTLYKNVNDKVLHGEPILQFDKMLFQKEQIDMTVLLIITNASGKIIHKNYGDVSKNDVVIKFE